MTRTSIGKYWELNASQFPGVAITTLVNNICVYSFTNGKKKQSMHTQQRGERNTFHISEILVFNHILNIDKINELYVALK